MVNFSKMKWVSKLLLALILAMTLETQAAKPGLTTEAYAVLENGTLTFKYDDQKPSGAFELNTGANTPGWNASAADITKVVFDTTFASCYPVSCYFWFKDCKKLTEIQGIENLNTRDVTNMKAMFQDCQVLGDIDLSQFVTDKVTDMSCMFRRCKNMQIFDFSSFNTSAVTNFESMFEECAIIVELDLSGFDISSAESIQCMFTDCQNLQRLNLRLFDTKNVTNMKQIFQSCLNLGTIYASKDWVIGSSTNTTNMFDRCGRVKGGAGTTFVTSDAAYAIIDQGASAPGYFTAATITQPDKKWMLEYNGKPQALLKHGTIGEFLYKLGADGEYGKTVPRATDIGDYTVYYKSVDNSIPETAVEVSIAKGRIRLITAPAATPRLLYSGEPKALVIKGTASVGEIVYSLDGETYSATIPTATDAGEYTVYYKVDGDDNYIGISPTTIKSTIYEEVQEDWTPEWYALLKDGVLTFYYDVFKPVEGAFTAYNQYNDAWGTDNTEIAQSITKVVFDDSFANYKPTICSDMFFGLTNLTEIEGIKNLNTENVTNMTAMFSSCEKLTEIDLSGFNTAKVTGLQRMFYRCYGLTELDLSSFNTSALASYASQYEYSLMSSWFGSCTNLKTIYVNDYWDMSNVISSNMNYLFMGSTKLEGGNGTKFSDLITNYDNTDYKSCAVIDKAGQQGLLTYKKAKAVVIAPKQKTLTYNGKEQPLVSGLSTNFGTILYRLGSEGEYSEEIPTATDAKEYTVYYKVADGDKFTGTEGSVTVTIAKTKNRWEAAPAAIENLVYTGEKLALATAGTPTFGKAVYSLDGKTYSETVPAVADAGTYTVYYKVDGTDDFNGIEASSFEVTIDRAAIKYTQAPAGVGNLVYSGSEQALVSAGTANAGSILYSLDGENYGKEVPTAANTGSYTVYYKVDGDNNHTGIEPASINVSIAKKQITITEAPEAVEDLVYSGKEQALVTAGTASAGKIIYSLNGVGYSYDIPTATDAGEYTVYYQVLGNDNYIGVEPKSINVTISERKLKAYAVIDNGVLTFCYDIDKPADAYSLNEGTNKPDWLASAEEIEKVEFKESFADYKPVSCSYWFNGCKNLTKIDGIENLNTEDVTTMTAMFQDCQSLTNVDLKGFSTANVTAMNAMFRRTAFAKLDLSNFSTEKVTDFSSMFEKCQDLQTLDISSFNTAIATNFHAMFLDCSNLATIYVGEKWSTQSATDDELMFRGCTEIVGGKGTSYDADNINGEYARNDKGESEPGYFTQFEKIIAPVANTLTYNGELQALVDPGQVKTGEILYKLESTGTYSTEIPTAENAGKYTVYYKSEENGITETALQVTISPAINEYIIEPVAIKDLEYTGKPQELVTNGLPLFGTIIFSLDGKQYSESVPTATSAGDYKVYYKISNDNNYYGVEAQTIDVTISERKRPAYAVLNDGVLTFYYDNEIRSNTYPMNEETDKPEWLASAEEIEKVKFDESFADYKPVSCGFWFNGCVNLTQIEGIENLNTEDVKIMTAMFQDCLNLKKVDLKGFSTTNVTAMNAMFRRTPFTSLDLSNFSTENVTDFSSMFEGCLNLKALDLSKFNMASATNLHAMFLNCDYLTTIFTDKDWTISEDAKLTMLFDNCHSLVGGKGTTYNANNSYFYYARIDGGEDAPGYFTKTGEPVYQKTVVSIEVTTLPTVEYNGNNELSAVNGKLTITYNDNTTEIIDLPASTITGYDKTKTGEQTLKIEYEGVETYMHVPVKDNTTTPVSAIADRQSIKVWSYNHTLYINAPAGTEYRIIDLGGRVLTTSSTTSTREEISINHTGVVIVIINGKSFKVAL